MSWMAPVRACLAGEDLDWLGGRCCCVALNMPTVVSSHDGEPVDPLYSDAVLAALSEKSGCSGTLSPPWRVTTAAPIGSGLSTSSSLVIALAQAWADVLGEGILHSHRLAEICYAVEHNMDQGGGMDHLTIIEGGVLLMSGRRDGLPRIRCSGTWPASIGLVVISSGQPKSTSVHLRRVRAQLARRDPKLNRYMVEADEAAELVWHGLVTGNLAEIADAINRAHVSMRDRQDMSTNCLEDLRETALAIGFSGVKVTGSGGGGALLAVAGQKECAGLVARLRDTYATRGVHVRVESVEPVAPGWYGRRSASDQAGPGGPGGDLGHAFLDAHPGHESE